MIEINTLRKARRYAANQYRKLRADYRYTGHPSHAATLALARAGIRFDIGHGPEGFCWDCGRSGITYLNMGDAYDATILFNSDTEQFRIGCYGDVVEQLERRGITLD